MLPKLPDKIALVTGATRGSGRAIAEVLGACGATVYVTGRSVRGQPHAEGLPGTIEDTAEAVTARGGRGIALRCDHTMDEQVEAVFDRISRDHGRLDLLVNNAWGGYEQHSHLEFTKPFWEQPIRHWNGMFTAGVRAALVASRYAAPMMIAQRRGLVVNMTAWAFDKYLGNLFYDVAKAAVNRMVVGMSAELRGYGVAAVALAPGFMRTERVRAALEGIPGFDWNQTESPEYAGRAIAHLAADPGVLSKSGHTLTVGALAREYSFTDVDGRQPPPFDF